MNVNAILLFGSSNVRFLAYIGYQCSFTGPHPICAELSEISLMCVAVNVVNKFLFGNSIICLTGPREQSRGFGGVKIITTKYKKYSLKTTKTIVAPLVNKA